MGNRIDTCRDCFRGRRIAADGRCYQCYRRIKRNEAAPVDAHSPAIRREQKKTIRAYCQILAGLADLRVSHDDAQEVLAILDGYLGRAAEYLRGPGVNSEQPGHTFTVHSGSEAENTLDLSRAPNRKGYEEDGAPLPRGARPPHQKEDKCRA